MINLIKFKIEKVVRSSKNISIHHMISISFTVIAVIGMLMVGGALYLRFINSTKDMVSENNKSMVEQVNLNLDSYLRNIMKVSDATYYNVIKKNDLGADSINKELDLLYQTNDNSLSSICVFSPWYGIYGRRW